jgi:hypothetical protein
MFVLKLVLMVVDLFGGLRAAPICVTVSQLLACHVLQSTKQPEGPIYVELHYPPPVSVHSCAQPFLATLSCAQFVALSTTTPCLKEPQRNVLASYHLNASFFFLPINSLRAEYLDGIYSFDLFDMAWTTLSVAEHSIVPPNRNYHGFTSAGTKIYVHGGQKVSGPGTLTGFSRS